MSISAPACAATSCEELAIVRQDAESRSASSAVSYVVAMPVCNERERIVGCLDALARQAEMPGAGLGILLFLNNCTDGTRQMVDAWVRAESPAIRIVEVENTSASAGWARRQAMDAAADWLEESGARDGVLLTTDADSLVPSDWVHCNAAAIAAGADAVAGLVAFDTAELAALPPDVQSRQRLEMRYETLLAEIEARFVPCRGNPWPCHRAKSGASIAVTLAAYRRVGGMPPLRSGEDHAFIDLVAAQGLIVRHALDVVVTTSGRLDGRAEGGTAATLKTWRDDLEHRCDARLERLGTFVVRLLLRRLWPSIETAARGVPVSRLLRPRELPRQIRRAQRLLWIMRWLEARRAGRRPSAPGFSPETPQQLSMP